MSNELLIALVVAAVLIALAVGAYVNYRREAAFARVATSLGLTLSERDDSSVRELAFPLFHEGNGTESGNLVSGTLQGTSVAAFDFAYWTEWRDSEGSAHRQYPRFLCAVSGIAVPGPGLSIELRSRVARLAGAHDLSAIHR